MFIQIKYAVRSFLKSPVSAGMSVAALALGIGVNVSCFISIQAMVLRGLPYPHLDRIVSLWENSRNKTGRDSLASGNYFDLKDQNRSFEQIGAYRPASMNLTGSGDPVRVQGCFSTPGFFAVLGMQPRVGRTFSGPDDGQADERIAIVSDGFWKHQLASSPNILGSKLTLDGLVYTVIGVMPADFDYPLATDLWIPLNLSRQDQDRREAHTLLGIARLKPSISLGTAQAESNVVASRLQQLHPSSNLGREFRLVPISDSSNQLSSRFVVILSAAAGFVLLLACANVSNIQLVRSMNAQRGNAIRSALGADRLDAVRRSVLEAILLGIAGGGLGLFLAAWNLEIAKASIPAQVFRWVPGLKNMRVDGATYGYTLALSLLFGALCAIPSLMQLRRKSKEGDLSEVLRSGRTYSALVDREWLRSGIVVIEVALALVLLSGATLMIGAFRNLSTANPGYDPRNVMAVDIAPSAAHYRTPTQFRAFFSKLIDSVREIRGAKAAAVSGYMGNSEGIVLDSRSARPDDIKPEIYAISDQFFTTMRIPILRGTGILASDGQTAPLAAVISKSVARFYWPNSSPLGRKIKLHDSDPRWLVITGVSDETRNWFGGTLVPAVYVSYLQSPAESMRLLIRTSGNPLEESGTVRQKLSSIDPNESGYEIKTLEQILSEQTSGVRVAARTMLTYGLIALILAVTGVYGVNSYIVTQRTSEIGIRLALGADRLSILRLFLQRAAIMAGTGLAIGMAMGWTLNRLVASLLEGAIQLSPYAFVGLTLALGVSALAAAYFPARRATTVDPMIALRTS